MGGMTIMQNSLNGTFGQSGDISNVPPRAATIGPIDVMRAKERIEVHALATNNTFSSWQRMTSRLVTHGPVTPYVPSSMLQTKKTQVYISEELAAPFECWEKVGYEAWQVENKYLQPSTGKQGKCLYTLAKCEETDVSVSSLRLLGSILPQPQNTSGKPDGSAPSVLIRRTIISRPAPVASLLAKPPAGQDTAADFPGA